MSLAPKEHGFPWSVRQPGKMDVVNVKGEWVATTYPEYVDMIVAATNTAPANPLAPLVLELANALRSIGFSGLLQGPTNGHDTQRGRMYAALASFKDAQSVWPELGE